MDTTLKNYRQSVENRHSSGRVSHELSAALGQEGGYILHPQPVTRPLPDSPIIADMNTIWDPRKFAVARHPLAIAQLALRDQFSRAGCVSCTDMPIKFPGSHYKIPRALLQFSEALQSCIDFEHAANPDASDKYYAYLTIDQKFVPDGGSQRGIGWHSDSIQGPRISPKVEIEHTYLCVDRDPTQFSVQPFDLNGYDVDRHWFNAVFEKQARPESTRHHRPYTISLLDAYSVHTAIPATADSQRTLLRLIYSVRPFDRLGNTHNDLFDYQWKMEPRPIPGNLAFLRK